MFRFSSTRNSVGLSFRYFTFTSLPMWTRLQIYGLTSNLVCRMRTFFPSVRSASKMMSRPQLPPLPGAPVTGSMTGNGIVSQHQAPRPNGFHVPCPVAPLLRTAVKDSTTNNAVVVVNVVNKSCPQHGTKAEVFFGIFLNFLDSLFVYLLLFFCQNNRIGYEKNRNSSKK